MRKKSENPRTERIEFRCTKEEKEAIEALANYLEMSTGRLIRNLVIASYDNAIIMKKLGALKGMKKYLEFKAKLEEIMRPALPGL